MVPPRCAECGNATSPLCRSAAVSTTRSGSAAFRRVRARRRRNRRPRSRSVVAYRTIAHSRPTTHAEHPARERAPRRRVRDAGRGAEKAQSTHARTCRATAALVARGTSAAGPPRRAKAASGEAASAAGARAAAARSRGRASTRARSSRRTKRRTAGRRAQRLSQTGSARARRCPARRARSRTSRLSRPRAARRASRAPERDEPSVGQQSTRVGAVAQAREERADIDRRASTRRRAALAPAPRRPRWHECSRPRATRSHRPAPAVARDEQQPASCARREHDRIREAHELIAHATADAVREHERRIARRRRDAWRELQRSSRARATHATSCVSCAAPLVSPRTSSRWAHATTAMKNTPRGRMLLHWGGITNPRIRLRTLGASRAPSELRSGARALSAQFRGSAARARGRSYEPKLPRTLLVRPTHPPGRIPSEHMHGKLGGKRE